jgi:PAP2 superfamily protein
MFMAWQVWKKATRSRKLVLATLSLLLAASFLSGAHALDLTVPYLPLAIAGGLVFYLRVSPKRVETLIWLLLSVLFGLAITLPRTADWILWGSAVLALPGLAGILLLALRCIWSERPARGSAFALLAPAVSMVFFVFSAQRVLGLANLLYSKTFDLYLFLADGSFGFQPSFLLSRVMVRSALLGITVKLVYVSLPFVMALVYAMRIPKNTARPSWDMIAIFLLAGLAGSLLYNILPATGPLYAFHGLFPWRSLPYESLKRLLLEPIPLPRDVPRNAIPSLHVAWAILLWWNARRLFLPIRVFTGAYLVLTILSTLATGEHYLVDVIAAFPFALCVQGIVSPENPNVKVAQRAWMSSCGLGLTLGWMLLIRFDAKWLLSSPVLPWALATLTIAGATLLNRKLGARDDSSEASQGVVSSGNAGLPSSASEMACNPQTF